MLLAARIAAGLCGGSIGVAHALAADVSPPSGRTRAMARLGIAIGVAFTVGPLLGAAGGTAGFTAVALLGAGLAAVAWLTTWRLIPHRPTAGPRPSGSTRPGRGGLPWSLRRGRLRRDVRPDRHGDDGRAAGRRAFRGRPGVRRPAAVRGRPGHDAHPGRAGRRGGPALGRTAGRRRRGRGDGGRACRPRRGRPADVVRRVRGGRGRRPGRARHDHEQHGVPDRAARAARRSTSGSPRPRPRPGGSSAHPRPALSTTPGRAGRPSPAPSWPSWRPPPSASAAGPAGRMRRWPPTGAAEDGT